ncbi:hypothetical protein J7E88_14240 [Streptomyces sp. ISL-10]|uniref:hypothetical protein n=1 Tax=Streptomyces sp. ISL-10 TaxID=2819172 RepID=UPI001BEA6ED4|nr:hypothetical protein [Streptomyces sp. ISL-10]MBT2366434.1 hypothetical protein [Streptomyces sp. ISL-10]
MTNARSPMRALRAALFAAVAVILAAIGHLSQSAHDVPASGLFAALGVTAVAGWCAAGRRRGACSIGAGLLAVQGALHLLFSGAGRTPSTSAPTPTPHHHAWHGQYDTAQTAVETFDTGMLAVHLLATAGCALWLAHGEAAFFRYARAALAFAFTPLRLLLAVVPLPAPRPAARPAAEASGVRRPGVLVLAHTVIRRGPPACAVPRATAPGAAV